jgi:3-oxoacyl-[acyl-carrier-protein] synthase II
MNVVAGIGWIDGSQYGCVLRRICEPYPDLKSLRSTLQEKSVFSYPVKAFGKYDRVSQTTCCAAALAFSDAGMRYSEDRKQDIGILGTNSDGCLQSNLDFFSDFVKNGRRLGRANLFVYTLPSTPVAEAAIYFKCQGPLLYMGFPSEPIASLLGHSDRMIQRGEATAMLAVSADEEAAQCFLLRAGDSARDDSGLALRKVVELAKGCPSPGELIGELARL